jgi:hypothetical protein
MKKIFTKITIAFLCISLNDLNAQLAANYTFSSSVSTYTAISNGNVLGSDSNDDDTFDALPIGFTFTFCGVSQTSVNISSNGYFAFGSAFNIATQSPISDASGDNNLVSALGADIQSNTNGSLTYTTIGTAPNQIFVVQWENYTQYGEADNFYFQIRLHQTSNVLETFYGSFYCDANIGAYEVGLRGNSASDYNNRLVLDGLNTWATSLPGGSSSDPCEVNPNPFIPGSGQRYVWSPPCPAPTIAVSASQPTICEGSSVSFTANGATSYTWSTSSTSSVITVTPPSSLTYTVKGESIPGCTAAVTCTIGVVPGPSISMNAQPSASFCPGMTGTLVAAGANNGYTWNPTGSTFAIINIAPTVNVTYTIVGANQQGCTTTTFLPIFMTTCTAVYDPDAALEPIRVFPNPSNGQFVIELANGFEKQIEVMDLTGRIVLNKTTLEDRTDMNIIDLPNGVYYIRLRSNNDMKVFKVVKE